MLFEYRSLTACVHFVFSGSQTNLLLEDLIETHPNQPQSVRTVVSQVTIMAETPTSLDQPKGKSQNFASVVLYLWYMSCVLVSPSPSPPPPSLVSQSVLFVCLFVFGSGFLWCVCVCFWGTDRNMQ